MKKVTKLIDYKNMLLKREGDLRVSRGLIDPDADAESESFEAEGHTEQEGTSPKRKVA